MCIIAVSITTLLVCLILLHILHRDAFTFVFNCLLCSKHITNVIATHDEQVLNILTHWLSVLTKSNITIDSVYHFRHILVCCSINLITEFFPLLLAEQLRQVHISLVYLMLIGIILLGIISMERSNSTLHQSDRQEHATPYL